MRFLVDLDPSDGVGVLIKNPAEPSVDPKSVRIPGRRLRAIVGQSERLSSGSTNGNSESELQRLAQSPDVGLRIEAMWLGPSFSEDATMV